MDLALTFLSWFHNMLLFSEWWSSDSHPESQKACENRWNLFLEVTKFAWVWKIFLNLCALTQILLTYTNLAHSNWNLNQTGVLLSLILIFMHKTLPLCLILIKILLWLKQLPCPEAEYWEKKKKKKKNKIWHHYFQ